MVEGCDWQEYVATERDALQGVLDLPQETAVVVVRTSEGARAFELSEGAVLNVGRLESAEISINHPSVSRKHAVLRCHAGIVTIEDLGTPNATRLDGVPLPPGPRPFAAGAVVTIGPAELRVAHSARAPARSVVLGAGRLERELAHITASRRRAALFRIALRDSSESALAFIAREIPGLVAVEAVGANELAALVLAPSAEEVAASASRLAAFAATATLATYPDDGATIASLWEKARARADEDPLDLPSGLVAADPAMLKALKVARRLAATTTTVLLTGETGVGKEVVAELIHGASPRAARPFIRLNCGSLPETLLESELFGHERGAFTGATQRKVGYFEAAQDGTLLIDEIGELGLGLQAKLLRVLESRRVARLGATEEIPIRARLLFATHRDLRAAVDRGAFREDLFYRISTFTLRVPPLRERSTEILLLAERFRRHFAASMGVPVPSIDPAVASALLAHPWPGNVRELKNAIEHALVLADGGDVLRLEHLPEGMVGPSPSRGGPPLGSVRTELEQVERSRIAEALSLEGGNRTHAARRLGMSRRALIYKLAKYGLER